MNIDAAHWANFFTGGVHHAAVLDSTQAYIHDQVASPQPLFCRADEQRAGTGQRGRTWQSPPGNLYCSMRLYFDAPPYAHFGLTQWIALTLCEALDTKAQALKLKWPNDLFTEQGKCGGILVETQAHDRGTLATIGIGLNLSVAADGQGLLGRDLDACYADVNTTLNTIMPPLIQRLNQWRARPYLPINHRWRDYDAYHGAQVSLDQHPQSARLHGIDQKGRLIATDSDGLHFLTQVRIKADA